MRLWLPAGYAGTAEIEVKRSRFLASVARVDDEEAARAVVAQVRNEHPAARHHCSAFIVEVPQAQPIERSSDDGEPSGTAGAPMLDVLRAAELTQLVAVVTRYFGGVLLGTGGLARAYAEATAAALVGAPRVRPVVEELFAFQLDHAEAGRVEGALLERGVTVVDTVWGADVTLTVATVDFQTTQATVQGITQRAVELRPAGERTTEKTLGPMA